MRIRLLSLQGIHEDSGVSPWTKSFRLGVSTRDRPVDQLERQVSAVDVVASGACLVGATTTRRKRLR